MSYRVSETGAPSRDQTVEAAVWPRAQLQLQEEGGRDHPLHRGLLLSTEPPHQGPGGRQAGHVRTRRHQGEHDQNGHVVDTHRGK